MKVFKYLQLITIKNPNFNVPLNIFLFHNWTKIECLQISKFLPLKMYEVRRFYLGGQIVYRSFVPPIKNGVYPDLTDLEKHQITPSYKFQRR